MTEEQKKQILSSPEWKNFVDSRKKTVSDAEKTQEVGDIEERIKARRQRLGISETGEKIEEQPKKDGFLKSVGKAIAKPFGEIGVGLYNAAKATADLARGDVQEAGQELESSRNLPFLGETKPFMTGQEGFGEFAKKTVGYGADIGSNVVGGFGVGQVAKQGFKGALRQGVSAGLKTGASTGALVGAGQSLEENKNALNVLGNALGGAILGGATGGALGGATATAGKVIRGVLQPGKTISDIGKGIKGAGESIQQRVIKPTQKDIKAGFKIENVSKYDVGGNLGDSFVKVKDQIKSNMDELNNIVSTIAPKKRYKFDLENYVNELEDKYRKGGVQLLGQGKKVLDEVENLKGELDLALGSNWRDNLSGFEDVLDIKRRSGLNAAFMHDATKSQPTPEEKVWTDFYMLLKDKLEKEAPPEFQAVNKRLSELIPIEQALIRRIPIAERQNVLNVADIVSLSAGAIDPRALTIGVLNRVLRSGTVASKLMQAGSKIEGTGAKLVPTDELIKSIPSNNKGFARLPFNQLIQEAKKYKSAEEFVKSQSLYHGTPNELEGGVLKFGAGKQLKKGGYMGGHFLTDTPEIAENFSFGGKVYQASGEIKNKVLDVNKNKKLFQDYIGKEYLSDGEKLKFTQQDFDIMFPSGKADWSTINTDLVEQLAKKQGKIGVAIPEYAGGKQGMTYQIFEDNIPVYTKSQLTEIWNKENKRTAP